MLIWDMDDAYSNMDDCIRVCEDEVRIWADVAKSQGFTYSKIVRTVRKYEDTTYIEWHSDIIGEK